MYPQLTGLAVAVKRPALLLSRTGDARCKALPRCVGCQPWLLLPFASELLRWSKAGWRPQRSAGLSTLTALAVAFERPTLLPDCTQCGRCNDCHTVWASTPCRYTVEQLKGGLKTTALYKPLPSQALAPGDPEPCPGSSDQAASAPGSAPVGFAAPGPRDVAVDVNGVPKRRSGVSLAPWLRWGSLLSFDSPMAMHALQVGLISALGV